MGNFLRDPDSDADLVSRMPETERAQYLRFGHLRIESAFAGRVFILYRPTGLNALNRHREPHVLSTLLLTDFMCDARTGSSAKLVDQSNGSTMMIGHQPRRIFEYDLFMAMPSRMLLRWDARAVEGKVLRSLSFAVLIKTKNKSDFYSAGNLYSETPNEFLKLYPNANGSGTLRLP
jgi:hypothetical protein